MSLKCPLFVAALQAAKEVVSLVSFCCVWMPGASSVVSGPALADTQEQPG